MNSSIINYIPLVTGVVSLCVAFASYKKDAPFRLNRRFFTLSICIALWNLALFYQESVATSDHARLVAARFSHLGALFAAPTGLHFILRFIHKFNQKWMYPLKLSYFVSAILSIFLFSGSYLVESVALYEFGTYSVWGVLYPIHIVNLVSDYLMMLVVLVYAYAKNRSNVERNRILYILIGTIITVVTTLCNFLPAIGVAIRVPGHLGTLIFQIMVLFAMYRYRLMNLGSAVSRTLLLLLMWIIAGLGYVVLQYLSANQQFNSISTEILWNFFAAGLFILFVLFVQKWLLPAIEKVIYPLKADTGKLLSATDKVLEGEISITEMTTRLTSIIKQSTNVSAVVVYIKSESDNFLQKSAEKSDSNFGFPDKISNESPLYSVKSGIVLEELKRDLATEQWMVFGKENTVLFVRALEKTGIEAVVPMESKGILYGIIGFGRKRFGGVYNPDDLEAFKVIGSQVAKIIAIHSASVKIAKREHLAQIGEMTAVIAHEIKNPLGAIKGAAEQMAVETNSSGGNLVSIIREEAARLDKSIKTYLAYAKTPLLNVQNVNLARLINRCVELFMSEAATAGFAMETNVDSSISVEIDPDAFRQIFFNIAKNSFEARKDGQLIITASLSGKLLQIKFVDNCGGMEKGVFDKIFLPFYTTKTNGTGLGMAVCKKLAAAMNGNLEATTNSGRGTEFMLEIKLQTA